MKITLNSVIILLLSTFSTSGYAFPELPFCPAGGPTGWLNHFNYKRDQNIWRRHSQYRPAVYNKRRYPGYYYPAYNPVHRRFNPGTQPYAHTPQYQRD